MVTQWAYTGIEELVDHFRDKYPDRYAEVEWQPGAEGAVEFIKQMILLTSFGGNPFLKMSQSPEMSQALKEHSKRDPIPDVFLKADHDSGYQPIRSL